MRYPEEELISILRKNGVDFTTSLPCEKFKTLLELVAEELPHVPLTREEEGVGICAGAALAGKRPVMFIQSSGIGNMINALLSLTVFYELPLAIFVSQRGIYKEGIEAQLPMGKGLPKILRGAGIGYSLISTPADFGTVESKLGELFRKGKIHAFLLNPAIWENSGCLAPGVEVQCHDKHGHALSQDNSISSGPQMTRYEILQTLAPFLSSRVVVCNLGFPSKELYQISHQPSNFYMLGSMGMALPIGLGISISSSEEVIVIEGDGSLLMNPGTLATTAFCSPANLTIIAIDNGSYGSTGNQPTLTRSCVELGLVARGFGLSSTFRTSSADGLKEIMVSSVRGPKFVHVLAVPGNEAVPAIPLHHLKIKQQVQEFLRTDR